MATHGELLEVLVSESIGRVSAWLHVPESARAIYVFAHGAGAGMQHAFMERVSVELAAARIGTLRYQFPYMQAGRRRPDPPAIIHATVRAAVAAARQYAPGLPLIAGGKSFGGRMTSQAQAAEPLPGVVGLLFLSFPLHPPGRPSDTRAKHLDDVRVPMLFLQGTRDTLADLTLIRGLCTRLGDRATLHVVEGGDHSLAVLKRSGRRPEQVFAEVVGAIGDWLPR